MSKLQKRSEKLVTNSAKNALAHFNDDIAEFTSWEPTHGGGANFATHKLFADSDRRVEFVGTNTGVILPLIFVAIGIAGAYAAIFNSRSGPDMAFTLFLFLPFLAVGVCLFYVQAKPIVFDLDKDCFWSGFKAPSVIDDETNCSLSKIHAIQLIGKKVKGSKGSYRSYELNLVLKTGDRIHVVTHGDIIQIHADAISLGQLLNKPVWDVTSM